MAISSVEILFLPSTMCIFYRASEKLNCKKNNNIRFRQFEIIVVKMIVLLTYDKVEIANRDLLKIKAAGRSLLLLTHHKTQIKRWKIET